MTTATDWPTCRCGCGEPVEPSDRNHARDGLVKGGPTKYAKGHSPRARAGSPYTRFEWIDGCMIWTGDHSASGYGRLDVNGRSTPAHRFFYEQHYGPIPDGMVLHHLCERKDCICPGHLAPMAPGDHGRLHHALNRGRAA